MAPEKRDRVLIAESSGEMREWTEFEAGGFSPEVTVRIESTKEAALAAIREESHRLLSVIADNDALQGSQGIGLEIARTALEAGVPRVAIRSNDPKIRPPEGAEVWWKGNRLQRQHQLSFFQVQ